MRKQIQVDFFTKIGIDIPFCINGEINLNLIRETDSFYSFYLLDVMIHFLNNFSAILIIANCKGDHLN